MEALRVAEAADRLGVSEIQVGRLIRAGELDAVRFGSAWAVDPASVERRAALRPGRGRPLSPRRAWALLAVAQLRPSPSIDGVADLAVASRRRGDLEALRGLPAVLDEVLADPRAVISGVAAGERLGAAVDGVAPYDLYVRCSDRDGFVADHRLRAPDPGADANIRIRAVADDVWPFDDDGVVSPLVAAVDLVEALDVRSAVELLALVGP